MIRCICVFLQTVKQDAAIFEYVSHLFVAVCRDRHHGGGRTDGSCYGSAQVHVHVKLGKQDFLTTNLQQTPI